MLKASNSYLQTQVNTTTPGELLIMLYDACVKNLNMAKDSIRERDVKTKGILISKAIDILTELQSSLNQQRGGDIAVNLQKLYFYCNTRLLHANMKMDCAIIDEVIKIVSGIRDAYYQIVSGQVQVQAQAPAAAKPAPAPAKPAPAPASADAAAKPALGTYSPAAMKPQAAPLASAESPEAATGTLMPPRSPNPRAFAAYASAHKQSA